MTREEFEKILHEEIQSESNQQAKYLEERDGENIGTTAFVALAIVSATRATINALEKAGMVNFQD